ncbi:hypothetical protein Q9Q95_02095 [Sphingomonas sp. DG1-23]|uniref:hypothetical protein n=1 Tax=Sphingomonas sp. DG1-23 TaxID=3068316 RepID=UPI00273FB167|nr:hypothetical protein [Sphingomonas sp. DG1-23]MDP5277702.1 hypothetical protein [Sphingomonas sp. DG1-23]
MSVSFFLAMMLLPQNSVDAAGDRLVPLVSAQGRSCTPNGRWCVALAEPEDDQVLPRVHAGAVSTPMPPPAEEFSNETHTVWPNLVLLKDGGFLAGVEARTSTAYSGGGGSATELRLFRISTDGQAAATPVLRVPVAASLLIRACFGERDMKNRRGACHDEYSYSGDLGLAGEAAEGLPTLAYRSEANAFPRGVSRMEDSNAKPRLKKSDLVRERDPECSFSRRFRFDAAAGGYAPDAPLPDCSAYTVP